jgi:hypothetical protein
MGGAEVGGPNMIYTRLSRVQRSLEGWSKPRWSNGTIYAHCGPRSGLKESILFLEIVLFLFLGNAAKLRWAGWARSAPLGVAMRPKRRVRAREAKTH